MKPKKGKGISRREFINGAAIGAAASGSIAPLESMAQGLLNSSSEIPSGYYPPALTGLRGSHEGSFEVAHGFRDGETWDAVETGERDYDLVIVGAGISGLAAAYFY